MDLGSNLTKEQRKYSYMWGSLFLLQIRFNQMLEVLAISFWSLENFLLNLDNLNKIRIKFILLEYNTPLSVL